MAPPKRSGPKVKKPRNAALAERRTAKTHPIQVSKTAKTDAAFDLRIAGKSFGTIAHELGVSQSTAYALVNRALEARSKRITEKTDRLVALEVGRMDRLIEAVWPLAMGSPSLGAEKAVPPDLHAVTTIIRLAERRSKLLGLDAPIKLTPTDLAGQPLEPSPVVQNFRQVIFNLPANGTEPGVKVIDAKPVIRDDDGPFSA